MLTKSFILQIVAVLSVAILLHGCGDTPASKAPTGGGGSTPAPKSNSPESVRLGYFANLTHAQALIGVGRGDFQKALGSMPLKTSVFNAGPSAVEAMFAGELDLTYIGVGPSVNAYVKSKGQAVRIISGSANNGVIIVVRKDSGITKLEDLKGKRIATPQYGNTQDIAARIFVKQTLKDQVVKDGGTTDIQAVANAEQIGLFKQGQLDAAWAPEPWGTRLIHEAGATLLKEEKDLWDEKKFNITIVLASKKFIDAYPELTAAFLKAHLELTDFIAKSPEQAAPIINEELKKLQGKPMAPEILKEALARVEFTAEPSQACIDKNAEWTFALGFIKEKPDVSGILDLSILKKVQSGK
jgi:NitT/TauT family transport system substrate-binding protein